MLISNFCGRKVFDTKFKSSSKSNGFGRYSNAPFFSALTAVNKVVLADITIIFRFGFNFCNFGKTSKASPSGKPTSVINISAKSDSTNLHIPAAVPLDLTL